MGGDDDFGGIVPQLPVRLLGDVFISIDTATEQAAQRGHPLEQELRILLVHGLLHLLGRDHERGEREAAAMRALETATLSACGWGEGGGLIAAAEGAPRGAQRAAGGRAGLARRSRLARGGRCAPSPGGIRMIALDMDGTLLDTRSSVLPSSASAIRAALERGIHVALVTGKARPAAAVALRDVGLEALADPARPGIFLQGLLVYGLQGRLLASAALEPAVVRQSFEYALENGIALTAFLGDDCIAPSIEPGVVELHERYHEPLARPVPDPAAAAGHLVRKLLFLTDPVVVERRLKPEWAARLRGTDAETMQALPNMLEIVPRGWNKWVALQHLLKDLQLSPSQLMAVGDGGNDLQMVQHAGIGVAMGNAVPEVLRAAKMVAPTNDEGGVAAAIGHVLCAQGYDV
ncbi:hypothetical protein QBZ16_002452 [Prototheca wickerhamii]|uniref:Uncharacterized protein n=1 Tax=Prototheca wickerhamii TaxID=3111 RepID=A0AAD9MP10_PROWI|nr:hypothetical protein QBZ16_002452 [Prototheca wickerhamii]